MSRVFVVVWMLIYSIILLLPTYFDVVCMRIAVCDLEPQITCGGKGAVRT